MTSIQAPETKSTATKRAYRATVQEEMKALSRQRIIDTVVELYEDEWLDTITLQQIADEAGLTVKTVMRHFGSKENLFVEAHTEVLSRPNMQRQRPEPGNIADAVACVAAHYEVMGRSLWRMLMQEDRYPSLRPLLENGRSFHATWVQQAFAPQLAVNPALLSPLYTLTDLFTWKLLRLERNLSVAETEETMVGMITAVISSDQFSVTSKQ